MVSHLQVWRFLCGRLVCLDVKDAFCSSLLIYNFRIFERRFGTRKFAVSIKVIDAYMCVDGCKKCILNLLILVAGRDCQT